LQKPVSTDEKRCATVKGMGKETLFLRGQTLYGHTGGSNVRVVAGLRTHENWPWLITTNAKIYR